ncbi:ABC transporter ATP-binding protein [Acholeplasma laidlawii]|uniref:ABC-type transport system, permease and ATPase components n=4 Tax=Acholeplasma laidlawii TaxID=2148 RepID=A9NGH9_ACHLI|nr:ABC transporter ATP-binding protein [Acholeplasma laidlawii]ABX81459.1 ABC-type transport system, permease and ATPase components [Acholeplasma laidlawii PG-8A]OED59421.1 ABC transporter [Acholeplasma laidlawii]RED20545.1 ATP-binding cassette subfamily B protein [Acholeplasma laidlawii]SQH57056.1 Putative multidrug export ATP-binding/permease protein SAV1866 [Acholeplasma laidlawii]
MLFIFRKMGKYKGQVIYSLIVKALAAGADLLLPFILAYMIDELLFEVTTSDYWLLIFTGIGMLLIALLGWFFNISANRSAEKVSSLTVRDVRNELFYKTEKLSASQVDEISTSSLISRLTSDTYNIFQMVGSLQRLGIRAPMLLIGGIIMSAFMDPLLTLVMIAMLPLISIVVWQYSKKGQPLYKDIQVQMDEIIRVLRENITGVRVVRALSMTDYEQQRFKNENKKAVDKELIATITMNKISPIISVVMNVGLVIVLIFGAYRVADGATKVGQILALITYFTIILNSMASLTRIFIRMSKAAASAERIVEVLNMETQMVDGNLPLVMNDEVHLEFDHVDFSYQGKESHLEDITFKISKGQTLGIIGATGSGKTTIINLIMRFYDPQKGVIKVFGEDIKNINRDELRRHVGLVLQNDSVFSDTIHENIAFSRPGVDANQVKMAKEIAQADFIDDIPETYNYEIAQRGTNISGGQRQRLLIARAVASNPKLLILDDASSALDYRTDKNLRFAITTHLKDTTKIIVAQRVSSIKDADLILIIDNGRIAAQGTHEELLKTNEIYQLLVKHQLGEGLV